MMSLSRSDATWRYGGWVRQFLFTDGTGVGRIFLLQSVATAYGTGFDHGNSPFPGESRVRFIDGFVLALKVLCFAGKGTSFTIHAKVIAGIDDIHALVSVCRRGDNGSSLNPSGFDKGRDGAEASHMSSMPKTVILKCRGV
jgi:hypothetical protein